MASEQDPEFAAKCRLSSMQSAASFTSEEIRTYLDLERTKFLALLDPDLEIEDPDGEFDEPWHRNPVMGAEELLRFSRVRQLLQ
jgi:hypothetical protein